MADMTSEEIVAAAKTGKGGGQKSDPRYQAFRRWVADWYGFEQLSGITPDNYDNTFLYSQWQIEAAAAPTWPGYEPVQSRIQEHIGKIAVRPAPETVTSEAAAFQKYLTEMVNSGLLSKAGSWQAMESLKTEGEKVLTSAEAARRARQTPAQKAMEFGLSGGGGVGKGIVAEKYQLPYLRYDQFGNKIYPTAQGMQGINRQLGEPQSKNRPWEDFAEGKVWQGAALRRPADIAMDKYRAINPWDYTEQAEKPDYANAYFPFLKGIEGKQIAGGISDYYREALPEMARNFQISQYEKGLGTPPQGGWLPAGRPVPGALAGEKTLRNYFANMERATPLVGPEASLEDLRAAFRPYSVGSDQLPTMLSNLDVAPTAAEQEAEFAKYLSSYPFLAEYSKKMQKAGAYNPVAPAPRRRQQPYPSQFAPTARWY